MSADMHCLLASELSPYGHRVRLAAALKGITLPSEPPPGGTGSAELKRIHPYGRIPVLLVGEQTLVESLALMEYLEDAWPGTTALRPTDPVQAARVRMIALLFDHNVIKALNGVFAQVVAPKPDPAAARAALDEVTREIEKLVSFFDADGFAVGDTISIADVAIAPFAFLIDALSAGFGAESPTQRVARFRVWWTRAAAVPEIAQTTAAMQKALAAMMAARKAAAA
jgi:glutathione S-transferase